METYKRILGPEHPNTLTSINNLAHCLGQLGRTGEALPLHRQAVETYKRILGPEHPNTLTSINNLAHCLDQFGHADEALPLYRQAVNACESVLGKEHPGTLANLRNLANCLSELGRASEALPLYRKALDTCESVLGKEHPHTLASLCGLAGGLGQFGHNDEALPFLQRALEAYQRVLGKDHPDTLTSLNALAYCLGQLGRNEEALLLFQEALAARQRVLGKDHPDTLASLNALAYCLGQLGRSEEALPLFQGALAARQRVLGKDHPDTLASLNNLAYCLGKLNREDEAVRLFQRALAIAQGALGPEDHRTLICLDNLALCLGKLGRAGEALPLHRQALEARERTLGKEHPDTLTSLNNLAGCLDQLGCPDEALHHWQSLAEGLTLHPIAGGSWLELADQCSIALANHALQGRLPEWDRCFGALSTAFVTALDLEEPEQAGVARPVVGRFFSRYLELCLALERHDLIPAVLAGRHGRKLAALVLEELESASAALDPNSLRGRFQALRLKLRRLAVGLQALEGTGPTRHDATRFEDAATAQSRQRAQWAAYTEALEEYRELRAELEKSDPEFSVTAKALNPSLEALQDRLDDGEVLVLLFEHEQSHLALVIGRDALRGLVTVEEAPLQRALARAGHDPGSSRAYRGLVLEDVAEMLEAETGQGQPPALPAQELEKELEAALWHPLARHLEGCRGVHLVTHGVLHHLPLELGAPTGLQVASYPGFVYYHRLRHQETAPSSLAPASGAHLGLAMDAGDRPGLVPIPFVHAERALVTALWPGRVLPDPPLEEAEPPLFALQVAAHGRADPRAPAQSAILLGDGALDLHSVFRARRQPSVVLLSACSVGLTADDPDGEPLGLVGAFLVKGARYVIAALRPVPDFYMPLFTALFHQAWQACGDPARALAEARHRLRRGDWYPDTETYIRRHYRPVIEATLTEPSPSNSNGVDPLLDLTHAWPFPPRFRALAPTDHRKLEVLRRELAAPGGPARLATEILDTFCAERDRLPPAVVGCLCTWVRGFGMAEPAGYRA